MQRWNLRYLDNEGGESFVHTVVLFAVASGGQTDDTICLWSHIVCPLPLHTVKQQHACSFIDTNITYPPIH